MRDTKHITILLVFTAFLQGCVSAGYEGQVGAMVSGDQMLARREANRAVSVFQNSPPGYEPLGEITVRRCHRSFVEEEPNIQVMTEDLKIAAYGQGGDAISNITTQKVNGLMANCWYVLEASAQVWKR